MRKNKVGDEYKKAEDYLLNLLGYRPYSCEEVRIRMRRKGVKEEIIEETINQAKRAGYLNDLEFAKMWVESRLKFKPRSRRQLRQELREKGIAEDSIEKVTEEINEEEEYNLAKRLVEQKLRRSSLSWDKMGSYLGRRGFSFEIIRKALEEVMKVEE